MNSSPHVSRPTSHSLKSLLSEAHPWTNYSLYGESIPHLLHWDFAYLWMLQRPAAVRPSSWQGRVEAWRRLLCMLLLRELELVREPIQQPLQHYTRVRGIDEVTFVRAPNTRFRTKYVGVLSPTVIVRPLPEPNRLAISGEVLAEGLPQFYEFNATAEDRRPQLAQVLNQAIAALGQAPGRLAARLAGIVRTEIPMRSETAQRTYAVVPLPYPVRLLDAADAAAWDQARFTNTTLNVLGGATTVQDQYVPLCSGCQRRLTTSLHGPVFQVEENIRLECGSCRAVTIIDLADFGMWREANFLYVWRDLHQFSDIRNHRLPPNPSVDGSQIRFEWNPGMLAGESVNVHLRLQVANATVQQVSPQEIKYNDLLVPGSLQNYSGYPIRPEWLFAVEQMPNPEIAQGIVKFSNMRLKGLRMAVSLPPYPASACKIIPDLQLGIYPRPPYPAWQRYRFFWSGGTSADFRLRIAPRSDSRERVAPTDVGVHEWHKPIPHAVALEKYSGATNASVGSSWILEAPKSGDTSAPIYLGVDFGTTTSVIYVDKQEGTRRVLSSDDFVAAAQVIAGMGSATADFLPSGESPVPDPTFLPSALWFGGPDRHSPIRWKDAAPSPQHRPIHGFKWGAELKPQRERYLDELLFLALPAALRTLFPHSTVNPNWNLGFSFPLAFSDSQRDEYKQVLSKLRSRVQTYAAGNPTVRSINESFACVRAFGQHQRGEVFLIADLGGGSLDVALFEIIGGTDNAHPWNEFQVGSAKIGGEDFLNALARRIGGGEKEHHYWAVRDAITSGQVAQRFAGAEEHFARVTSRFLPIPQELLRVMIEAYRQRDSREVQFVLVGNGWRTAEYGTGQPRAQRVAREQLQVSFEMFGVQGLRPYAGVLEADSKHLVAIGALQNAKPGGRHELEEAAHEAKLPAGRNIKFLPSGTSLHWENLVGPSVQNVPPGSSANDIEIDRSSGPPAPAEWNRRLNHALPKIDSDPSNAVLRESLKIVEYALNKGPLQVLLEKRAEAIE